MAKQKSTTVSRPEALELKSFIQPQGMDKQQLESALLRLQQWLQPTPTTSQQPVDTALPPLERISRFGLKSSDDVHSFLESPAGEALLKAIIEEELIEVSAMENAQLEQREIQLHKHYLALLILGMFYKHHAYAHNLIDHSLEEVSKKLHGETKFSIPDFLPTEIEPPRIAYSSEVDQIKTMLQNKLAASELLEKALAAITPQHKETEAKYKTFNSNLDKAEDVFAKIAAPVRSATSPTPKEPTFEEVAQKTQSKINELSDEVEKTIPKINELLDADKLDEARALMTESNAQRLQIASLNEMLTMYKAGNKLVEKDDKIYVLRLDQTLDDMSAEDIAAAEKHYKNMSPSEMGIKALVKHNQTLETAKYHALSAQSEKMQKDILLLADELTAAQNKRAQAELALKPTPTNSPAVKMSPLPSATAPTPAPSPKSSRSISDEELAGNSYEHVIRLMRNNPTPEAIKRLKESIAHFDTSSELKKQLNDLKPGVDIPMSAMNNILENIRKTRPGEFRLPDEIANEAKNPTATAPTPFKTRPAS